jgi:hypothetical protein
MLSFNNLCFVVRDHVIRYIMPIFFLSVFFSNLGSGFVITLHLSQ